MALAQFTTNYKLTEDGGEPIENPPLFGRGKWADRLHQREIGRRSTKKEELCVINKERRNNI